VERILRLLEAIILTYPKDFAFRNLPHPLDLRIVLVSYSFPIFSMVKMTDPATKADLRRVHREMVTKKEFQKEITAIREEMATKKDLAAVREEMATKKDLEKANKELLDGFLFIYENLVHDFRGAFSDRTEWLKDKVNHHDEEIVRIKHVLRLR